MLRSALTLILYEPRALPSATFSESNNAATAIKLRSSPIKLGLPCICSWVIDTGGCEDKQEDPCVCMRACVHACMRACVHACMRACVHACMRACMHACMHACMLHACIRACVHECMRACVHACMRACVRVHARVLLSLRPSTQEGIHLSPSPRQSSRSQSSCSNTLSLQGCSNQKPA